MKEIVSKQKEKPFLRIGYCMYGYPSRAYTEEFLTHVTEKELDFLELGIAYKDPLADGPVLSKVNGITADHITIDEVFFSLKELQKKTKLRVPCLLMTYYQNILHYGVERFFKEARTSLIHGVIIPDLPYEEVDSIYAFTKKYKLAYIPFVSVTSSSKRIASIVSIGSSFVYCVNALGVTGGEYVSLDRISSKVHEIQKYTNLPVALGFGIKTQKDIARIKSISDGAIVGTRIVEEMETKTPQEVCAFLSKLYEC